MPNVIGQQIGAYQIVALLGHGGMAEVFRARQTLGDGVTREVALKLIDARLSNTPEFSARFRREAQTLVTLSHPHILKAFDYGQYQADGQTVYYLVMELLAGGSLVELIRRGPLSFEMMVPLLDQIGPALDYAHGKGLVHRDLKPHNVLLDESGNGFLTDFGIVKLMGETSALTQSNAVIGTPGYMSPEQWNGERVDARSDLYAFGIMLFEMLTGRVPFQADSPYAMMRLHTTTPPPLAQALRSSLPPDVDRVLAKALAKMPGDRYRSAAALTADFKAALYGRPVSAPPIQLMPNTPIMPPLLDNPTIPAAVSATEAIRATGHVSHVTAANSLTAVMQHPQTRQGLLIGCLAVIVLIAVIGGGLAAKMMAGGSTDVSATAIPASPTSVPTLPTDTPTAAAPAPTVPAVALLMTDSPTAAATSTDTGTNAPVPPTETATEMSAPQPAQPTHQVLLTTALNRPVRTIAPAPAVITVGPTHIPRFNASTDVLAYCNNPDSQAAQNKQFPQGAPVVIVWQWSARTPQQITEQINNAQYLVNVDGQLLSNWQNEVSPVLAAGSGSYVVYWFVPIGNPAVGTHTVSYNLTWNQPVFNGTTNYGPNTANPSITGSCSFSVTARR